MRSGRGRTGARIEPSQIRRISTPKFISQNLPSLLGVRLRSFPSTQILRMTNVRNWLFWMRCCLTRFALTRMHLRLQVRGRHELELLRPKLLRRKLLRLPTEGEEEGDRAAEARNAPRHRGSRASSPIAPRKSRGRLLRGHRDRSITGNFCSRTVSSSVV